ncbi:MULTISPECIES: hypothetical protein [Paenibacillus]|uniref:Uncharacterized protein n=1 Tax=Paenibacillus naphthalenovorans TaxID=162209 RepID=A0A0U2M2T1_9BACL|nr:MULTISPECIES: hypothetical protein [Paenibacillus]ALS21664.1 hypothetical protein IJ22_12880 [Paenibacillus naphthalenovorans]NTZ18182.1 hypothetical protein [Paenibacillus sp. JMULE4]SDI87984.1 hypothetical protein SAMN05421868_11257 [Paenibacillus naphthalenovorans]
MANNKSMLTGLGAGMILGAVLLQLMNASSSTAVSGPDLEEMNPAQLKEAASVYFQVYDKDQKLYDQTQLDALVLQKLQQEKEKLAAEQQSAASAPVKETYIYISGGLTAGHVADMLLASGIITDRKAFADEMRRKRLNDKIVTGIHVFKSPMELSEVITKLTTR